MKRFALFAFFAVSAIATAAVLSADQLVSEAEKHDGKPVTVKGTVFKFQQKTSRAGNPYFTFRLKTKNEDNPVNVYGRGKLGFEPKDGTKVELSGTFRKEKKVQSFVVKNEIDVTPKEGEKPKVKVVEPGK